MPHQRASLTRAFDVKLKNKQFEFKIFLSNEAPIGTSFYLASLVQG